MKQSIYVLSMQSLPGTTTKKTTHINLMLSLKLEFSKMESQVLILKAHISFSIINFAQCFISHCTPHCDYITYQMMREVFYFQWFTFQRVITVIQRGGGVGAGQMLGFFRSPASPGKVQRGRRGQAEGKSLLMDSYSIIAHCTQTYAWKKRNVRFQGSVGMRQLPWTTLYIKIMYKASPGQA